MKRTLSSLTILTLLALSSAAHAEDAESINIKPTYLNGDIVKFNVPHLSDGNKVDRLTVQVRTIRNDGRVDKQSFDIHPHENWQSHRVRAATKHGNIAKMEISYVAHVQDKSGQRRAVESKNRWELTGQPRVSGPNSGRLKPGVDGKTVQGAVDRLANKAPDADFLTTPGVYYVGADRGVEVKTVEDNGSVGTRHIHPLHPELKILDGVKKVIAQKKADPQGRYFIRGSVYNMDSPAVVYQLREAKKAGIDVELITDHTMVGPHKGSYRNLVNAGISVIAMVRNNPARGGDDRTNHSKFWVMGKEDHSGKISQADTYQASFNHEFQNWPNNTEAMVMYPKNNDVATIYNYYHRAMAGRAPHLKVVVDPDNAQFISTHTLYPHVTKDGKRFSSRQAYEQLVKESKELNFLQYLAQDGEMLRKIAESARSGRLRKARFRVNNWKVTNHGAGQHWGELAHTPSHMVGVILNGSSPVHHKSVEGDGDKAAYGSWNMWRGSGAKPVNDGSDEQVDFIRSKKVARAIADEGNNLDHAYHTHQHFGHKSSYRTAKVTLDLDLERLGIKGIKPADVQSVNMVSHKQVYHGGHEQKHHQLEREGEVFKAAAELAAGHAFFGDVKIKLKSGKTIKKGVFFKAKTPVGAARHQIRLRSHK